MHTPRTSQSPLEYLLALINENVSIATSWVEANYMQEVTTAPKTVQLSIAMQMPMCEENWIEFKTDLESFQTMLILANGLFVEGTEIENQIIEGIVELKRLVDIMQRYKDVVGQDIQTYLNA